MASKSSRSRKRAARRTQHQRATSTPGATDATGDATDATDAGAGTANPPATQARWWSLRRRTGPVASPAASGAPPDDDAADGADPGAKHGDEPGDDTAGAANQGAEGPNGPGGDATRPGDASVDSDAADADDDPRRWGLGEVLGGWAISRLVASLAFTGLVLWLGYPVLAGMGAAVGQAVGRSAVGAPLEILTVFGELPVEWQLALQASLWVGLLGAPLYAASRKGTSLAVDFGFTMQRRDIGVGLAIGVGTQLVLVPLVLLPGRLLDPDVVAVPLEEPRLGLLAGILLVGIVGLASPVVEELFYRGLTQRAILKRLGRPAWAVVLAAVFFALGELGTAQFPILVAAGVIFGILAQRYGRLGPSIFAHIGFRMTFIIPYLAGVALPFQ